MSSRQGAREHRRVSSHLCSVDVRYMSGRCSVYDRTSSGQIAEKYRTRMGGAPEVALRCFGVLLEGILRERRGEGDGLMGGLREMGEDCVKWGKRHRKCFQMKGNWWFFATFFTSFSKNVSKCLNFVG